MKSLIDELNRLCTSFSLKEKIVIVDSHSIGEQINEAFVKEGRQAVNLKYKTVKELALNLVELNSDQEVKLLENSIGVQFTYSILKDLKEQEKLHYFNGMEITPSFSHAIYSTLKTLRLANYNTDTLKRDAFITSVKAADIFEILAAYENKLKSLQLTDKAELLANAMVYVQVDNQVIFILQSNLQLSYLEEQFLTKLLPEMHYKLPLAAVLGANTPEGTSLCSIRWADPTALSYLYQQDEAEGQADLSVFTAKTEELEIKQVLEKIKIARAPLDESVIYYTSSEHYTTLLYQLSQKLDIPITYGEGLPVMFSRPGRLVSGILKWIQSNYSVQAFLEMTNEGLFELGKNVPIIKSGLFDLDEMDLSNTRIAKILRELPIGWSQERYQKVLGNEIDRLGDIFLEDENNSALEHYIKEIIWLYYSFLEIFKFLPPLESTMNYKRCLIGIKYILIRHCKTTSALDELSKSALLEEIDKILPFADESMSSYEAFEKVKDLLLAIQVNQSRPKPGHLHVSSFKKGIYNSRPNVYVVGLDNKKFPGNASEDPILLDTERIQLRNNLPLLREQGQVQLYNLLQLLAQSTGTVTVSFCNFEINDNRSINPAFVVLQCYRFMTGNKDAEFKELKSLPSSLFANDIFEEKDYWNEKLISEANGRIEEAVLQQFPNVKAGMSAEKTRNSSNFSEYDGLVQIDAGRFDPRLNPEKTLSAGKLETLAKCPYSYFLKEVLRVRPVEEVAYDANKWLDAATRGSLLHSIFETFYKTLQQENTKPSVANHLSQIHEIANSLIDQQKEILLPPNERVYQREVNDILACCEIFLKEEERYNENYDPLHFEYSFGIGDKEPAIITLPSGEVKISGIIDRVDKSKDGNYHIIDYKTGSTYSYSKNGAFKGGRQLQHFIYALAIEQHLGLGEGAVEESTYYFPTVKGMAERFSRSQDAALRTNGVDILEKLIDVIKHGHFEMTDNEEDCKFCELKLVCRRHFYSKETLEKKQSNQKLKGVRVYD
ncbi:PD-(D/E)XK nuclease family protein [Neobacillus pocheonensis]|uniref:PD-(D/E)XK nuclease family protein n=1 Tax=Neobacillus pocheonensis TaxID=363869 RepID=UPI003D2A35A7